MERFPSETGRNKRSWVCSRGLLEFFLEVGFVGPLGLGYPSKRIRNPFFRSMQDINWLWLKGMISTKRDPSEGILAFKLFVTSVDLV